MSAGICIMNKNAIALAADSAVTIGQHLAIHNSAMTSAELKHRVKVTVKPPRAGLPPTWAAFLFFFPRHPDKVCRALRAVNACTVQIREAAPEGLHDVYGVFSAADRAACKNVVVS